MSTEKKEFGIDNPLVETNSSSEAPNLDHSLVSNDQQTNIELFPKATAEEQKELTAVEAVQAPAIEAVQPPFIDAGQAPLIEAPKVPVVEAPKAVAAPLAQTSAHILHNQMDWPIDAEH